MSSAILYLAIVAIWALVLVPSWLRRGQPVLRDPESDLEEPQAADDGADEAGLDGAGHAGDYGDPDPEGTESGPRSPADGEGRPVARWAGDPGPRPARHSLETRERQLAAARRARVLRARRRMLLMLALLTMGSVAMAAAGVDAWWVAFPPVALLTGFLVLLRAIVRMEAGRARAASGRAPGARGSGGEGQDRAEAGAGPRPAQGWPKPPRERAGDRGEADRERTDRAETARQWPQTPRERAGDRGEAGRERTDRAETRRVSAALADEAADARWAASAGSTAEIIDISGRIEDQPYDQYLDAEARAVGD